MTEKLPVVLHGEVLPAGQPTPLRTPPDAPFPLTLGMFGMMKYAALRRIIEARELAIRAATQMYDAQTENTQAYIRHAVALESVNQLPLIRADERNRILHSHNERLRQEAARERVENDAIEEAKLKDLNRQLRSLETQEQMMIVRMRMAQHGQPVAAPKVELAAAPAEDAGHSAFMRNLYSLKDIVGTARKVKEEIIRDAGGEDNLSEGDREMVEFIDATVKMYMSKRTESAA
jgi:hypothetical protein